MTVAQHQARRWSARLAEGVLLVVAAPFYAVGYVGGAVMAGAFWCGDMIRFGWQDGRGRG